MYPALHTAALLALLGCSSTGPDAGANATLRVLFIGNSLTYSHDIPALVAGLEPPEGPAVRVGQVAFPDFSLEDHWQKGDALDSVARGRWDLVVMQQGPSSVPANREHLIEWSRRFTARIRAAGARPAMYMVWPLNGDWDGVIRAYSEAASAIDGLLIPAGKAFRAVEADHPEIPLFASDGFHPSPAGAYLAALVIYGSVAHRSVAGTTARRPFPGLTPAQAERLERAADRANEPCRPGEE